jgi:hypothetical protein
MPEPRYDPERDVSRHAAASEQDCQNMAERNNWLLEDIEHTGDPLLPKDCVFKGKVEFPKPFNELTED